MISSIEDLILDIQRDIRKISEKTDNSEMMNTRHITGKDLSIAGL